MRTHSAMVAALTLSSAALAQIQYVVPSTHHLSETASQTDGTDAAFRETPGRFQVLYDGAQFVASGASGPVTVRWIAFRGEDTEQNVMGHSWTNVSVSLGRTSLTAATMSNDFATNRSATTTTLTATSVVTVQASASLGTAPNTLHIRIDVPDLTFDPTTENLLVDITMPNAPAPFGFPAGIPGSLIRTQDTTGTVAQIGGRMLTTDTVASATGTFANPPVLCVQDGPFQFYGPTLDQSPARIDSIGAACGGSPSGFYQIWAHNEPFDLGCTGSKKKYFDDEGGFVGGLCTLVLTPDSPTAPTHYTVAESTSPIDFAGLNGVADSTADDALVTHALGFTFAFPGGSTTTIKASTNGFVWLDPAMTDSDFSPSLAQWLGTGGYTARFAPFWHDFHAGRNVSGDPLAGLHVRTDTSGGAGNAVCYVTWYEVGRYNTVDQPFQSSNTLQLALFEATGVAEFRYGSPSQLWGSSFGGNVNGITGFTRGQIGGVNSVDPQSRDLSIELPFATHVEGSASNMGLIPVTAPTVPSGQSGRMFPGEMVSWNAINVPVGAMFGLLAIDVVATRPGASAPTITGPGCIISTGGAPAIAEAFAMPPPVTVGSFQLPIDPSWLGDRIYAQFAVVDITPGADLIPYTSNALMHTVGRQ